MRPLLALLSPSLVVPLAPVLAQSPIEVVLEQDQPIVGVGDVDTIDNLVVNDFGEARIWVDTDATTAVDEAIVDLNFAVLLQEGGALSAPAGATVKTFDSLTLDDAGGSFFNVRLDGTSGSSDDSGLFFGDQLLIQEGDLSTSSGFSGGTFYKDFREVKADDHGAALAMVIVDDPSIIGNSNQALVRFQVDAGGNLASETVVGVSGSPLPGMTSLSGFLQQPDQLAVNNAGQAMFVATGQPANTLYLDQTPLIQEQTPSPIPGRDFSSLSSLSCDVNDHGDWVAHTLLTGTQDGNQVLLKNGAVLAHKGQTHPDIAPFVFTSLGSGPVHIDNQGRALWYAAWSDGSSSNEGWFLDDELIIQEGVTLAEGVPIFSVTGNARTSDLSDDGGYFLFRGRTDGNHNAVFRTRLLPLTAEGGQISVSGGGTQELTLDAGPAHAGKLYLVAGSLSGTSPGTPLPLVTVPLNQDSYLVLSITKANQAPFVNTFGVLDGQGRGSAAIALPPGTGIVGLAGLTAHHAFVALDPVTAAAEFASNAVPLTFTN